MPTTTEMKLGLQAWAGLSGRDRDGIIGNQSIRAIWEQAGRPLAEPVKGKAGHRSPGLEWLQKLWDTSRTRPEWKHAAANVAVRIARGEDRYREVGNETGVPWWVVGVIHLMECNLSFSKHLHNGDSLNSRTRRVPAGRPLTGSPPFTWEESAIDAIEYDKLDQKGSYFWTVPASVLDMLERYNGLGYRKKRIYSPYLWSGTYHYTKGKYVKDGVYDKNAVSKQVGIAPVLKELDVLP